MDYYILVALLFGFAGIFVWQRGFKNRQNISFAMICIGIAMWLSGLFYLQHASDFYCADKLALLGGLISICGFYMFSLVFPVERWVSFTGPFSIKTNFYIRIIPLALWILILPFNLIIKGAAAGPHGPVPVNGPLFAEFGLIEIAYIIAAVRNFYLQFKNTIGHSRQRIVYVLAGMSFFLLCALIFDLALPALGIKVFNFIGPLSSLVFLALSMTAIISFNIFDVRLVLKSVIVYAFSAAVTIVALIFIHESREGKYIFSSRAFIIAFLGAIAMFAAVRILLNYVFKKYFLRGYYRSKQAFDILDSELLQQLDMPGIAAAANRHLKAGLQLKWIYFFDCLAGTATTQPADLLSSGQVKTTALGSIGLVDLAKSLAGPKFLFGLELPDFPSIADSPTAILPIWDGKIFAGYFVLGPQMNLSGMSSEQINKTRAAWAHLQTAFSRAALHSQLEERVSAQVQDIIYKNRKLKEAAMIQLDYAQMVSHQLRTPVTVLQGALELVLNPEISPQSQKDILRMAHQSSLSLSSIIEDVLSLARIRKAAGRETMSDVKLSDVFAAIMAVALPIAGTKNIKINLAAPADLFVIGNKSYLEQALFNIIENALQHAPQNGEVSISCVAAGSNVVIKVYDNGPGIPTEMQKSIFKKHLKTSNEKGIGLGLYIVKAVIDAHPGGKIWFETSDKGTVFYVQLRNLMK